MPKLYIPLLILPDRLLCCVASVPVLEEESCKLHITPRGRQMQRGRPVFVLGCRIGAVLKEEPYEVDTTERNRLLDST